MCGINGIISNNKEFNKNIVILNKLIKHRGPDDEGFVLINSKSKIQSSFSGDDSIDFIKQKYPHITTADFECFNIVFGHRRLSIIDLSEKGHCPMSDESGKIWITYNGEIYNYIELREELKSYGYTFKTESDTEVIIKSYQKWGDDCFNHFNGMWALALYDSNTNKLILSRDRFGIKPLYYINNGQCFAFSSEIKPLLYLSPQNLEINDRKIPFFILYGNRLSMDDTYIKNLYSLSASHYLVFQNGNIRLKRYYEIPILRENNKPENYLKEELINLLTDSVKLRYRSDVPVGTCLSGGLDSSSIVALSHSIFGKHLKTFSAVWSYKECDESRYIDIVNNEYGCDPNKVEPSVDEFEKVFEKLCYYHEIPTEGPGLYPQWYVMRMAKGKVKVLLDGQGGDEVFGGYLSKDLFLKSLLLDKNIKDLWTNLGLLGSFINKNGIHAISSWLFSKLYNRIVISHFSKRFKILKKEIKEKMGAAELYIDDSPPKYYDNYLNNLSHYYVSNLTIPTLLHYEDRSSMAHSIESRVPFLDYRLVEFGLNLSPNHLSNRNYTRPLFRKALLNYLPKTITDRKDKLGYPVPFNKWTRLNLKELVNDSLENPNSNIFKYIDKKYLKKKLLKHYSKKIDYSWGIWRLLSLDKFLTLDRTVKLELKQ
jgi:asparagine synthase (glutamine-hydrolysing)